MGSKVPGSMNWTGPPSASPTQTPHIEPKVREIRDGGIVYTLDGVCLVYSGIEEVC